MAEQVPAMPAPRAAEANASIVSRMTGMLSAHSYITLAIIVVLIVVIIGLVAYYRGFLFIGPFAKSGFKGSSRRKKGDADEEGDEAATDPPAKADPETEKLIASIEGRR